MNVWGNPMDTSHLVESLLSALAVNDEAAACYPELAALRARARQGLPLQWVLAVDDLPLARGLIRHAAQALLALLDALDEGARQGREDACPLWHTLRRVPAWLLRPLDPDDEVPDIALLLERDETCGGDWQPLIESLHRAGSDTWQWAIRRCRAMQHFEQQHACNLAHLLADGPLDMGIFTTFDPEEQELPGKEEQATL